MSRVGMGSEEMCSVLVDNNQLRPLQLMLNDLKTKLGSVTSYLNCSNILMCALQESGAKES